MTRRRAAAVVGAPSRHAEVFRRVVVAGAPDDDAISPRPLLASLVLPIGIRPEDGRCPLAQIAEDVLDAVRAPTSRPSVRRRGGVVPPTVDGKLRRGRCRAPRIRPAVFTARGLLPFRLGGEAPALPAAVVARAEPGHLDDRVALESRVGPPANGLTERYRADPRVCVVVIEASVAFRRHHA